MVLGIAIEQVSAPSFVDFIDGVKNGESPSEGVLNRPTRQLAERTEYLKEQVELLGGIIEDLNGQQYSDITRSLVATLMSFCTTNRLILINFHF
ncbi:hypothetical protein DTO96_102387 [Ephemeroptericola cinctiostellae]|uniref:Uncharacterized protein n=1 Tax=Ephemeroptericola cinctiostellae TaxID=2268024 RepID=A0A345DE44_9BURK|nr:hypothetical protein [Ephemeroptericola cinctiostellae]AXF86632.1 hypothetical protein DTO96_102387 [Ephemeroptericola cinctiostellae]